MPCGTQRNMKSATLLAKATQLPRRNSLLSSEEIELAVAWAQNDVSTGQVIHVLGKNKRSGGSIYHFFAMALREAVLRRVLRVKGVK